MMSSSAHLLEMKSLSLLGSTGSIGANTLDVVRHNRHLYRIHALAAGRNVETILQQIIEFRPNVVVLATSDGVHRLAAALSDSGLPRPNWPEICFGAAALIEVATAPEVDMVISAIVGVVGLEVTYAAVRLGKRVGLANKEVLVSAGRLVMDAVKESGAELLPIDSEHNGVHQCLRAGNRGQVTKLILTASGGPFRNTPQQRLDSVTPAQALNHPTWVMGKRITIDSATLLNKGLEIIEACRLFDLPPSAIRVTVHPQSTVHSLVEYVDGSLLAQISVTDMRLPILYALGYPERIESDLRFDMAALSDLHFEPPDFQRFPCLRLAYEAAEKGGAHAIALNAADEVAVEAFLERVIPFTGIPDTIEQVLGTTPERHPATIKEVLALDSQSRELAQEVLAGREASRRC